MQYQHKQFNIVPFQREPGLWRAAVTRTDGKLVTCASTKLADFRTSADTNTADEAVNLARRAIDAGYLT
jgi:hypothetical protein